MNNEPMVDETDPFFVLDFCKAALEDSRAGLLDAETATLVISMIDTAVAAHTALLARVGSDG